MPFTTKPLNLAGPSYQSRSKALSDQRTKNFYQEVNRGAKSEFVLQSFPGQKLFGTAGTPGADRGSHKMAGVPFSVVGNTLVSVSSIGAHTSHGTIPGTARCTFADDGTNLFICTAGSVYQYNGTAVSTVTDPDIVGSIAIDVLNNQFIYTKSNLFIISDVGNGASASGLNAAQAEAQPDDLVRAYVFDETVYMLGTDSIEEWYNTGSGSPPFARIVGQVHDIGLAALHSVSNTDEFMYWLGDDARVYRLRSGNLDAISNIGVSNAIEGYGVIDDAVGYTATFQGQNFYFLHFPTANRSWGYNESLGADGWFELSSGTNDGMYNGTSLTKAYRKNLVRDKASGELYEWSTTTYSDNGDTIQRQRVLSPIHGGLFGTPGRRLKMSGIDFVVQTGVGLITGQGEDPKMMVEYSIDDNVDWAHGGWLRLGRQGIYEADVKWDKMLSFKSLNIRLTVTDPVFVSLHSASIRIKDGGGR